MRREHLFKSRRYAGEGLQDLRIEMDGLGAIVAIQNDMGGLFMAERLFVRSPAAQGIVDVGDGHDVLTTYTLYVDIS